MNESGDSSGGERPKPPPDYKVYRARRGLNLGKPDLGRAARKGASKGGETGPGRPRLEPEKKRRPWLRWIGIALVGWLLLTFVSFAISATIQKSKLADMGTPGRQPAAGRIAPEHPCPGHRCPLGRLRGADESEHECVERRPAATPPSGCAGGSRADSIMVLRAGGGAFDKLSIPRDTLAAIPGKANQKINAAYAFGGAELRSRPSRTSWASTSTTSRSSTSTASRLHRLDRRRQGRSRAPGLQRDLGRRLQASRSAAGRGRRSRREGAGAGPEPRARPAATTIDDRTGSAFSS